MSRPPEIDWEHIYEDLPTGFQTPSGQRDQIDAAWGKGAAAYGEITAQSAETVLRWLAPTAIDHFYDLGSGIGRLVIQAACSSAVGKSTGIELAQHRHETALLAHRKLIESLEADSRAAIATRINFLQGDLLSTPFSDATLIYVGATCFPDRLVSEIVRLAGQVQTLRKLVTTRPLDEAATFGLIETGQLDLDMSWTEKVRVHVYAPRS